MNVLVTGGAGFIGSHVVRFLLEDGYQVKVVDNLSRGNKESVDSRAELIVADINNSKKVKEALKGVDAVIHMAGLIVVPESVKDPIKYCENNVIGAVSLIESMRKAGVKKIIFSSSACVYGTPDKLPIKEDAPVRPDNPYGASKASIETFLQTYNVIHGFDSIILRYFNPYGPGEEHVPETHAIPNFIKATLAKKPIPLYWQGEQIRDFIYIEDLARAHIDVLDQKGYQVFNIGTEKGIKVKDVISEIFKIVGYEVPIKDLGERLGDVHANFASSEKLKKAVGWRPKVELKDGLKRTVDYYES
ncbi:UDP-glucose 4-epimerase GalE [Candidatus Curtissbacteria bacterium RIFCSPLOWO2_02_FULL_40_11]|uniref:UDP-glucose 4-epimerase n=2 Tax=Candidatus Curtissiibacteriota TaxID=1752717 RepID=A0A1F5GBX1_9BACT|nr:MAG: UDP-glucose 4-epimerase GalE [Candidatus Curtissbacteria bacterium RIFCSPHIGHO2_02_FULL_40_16b]OGD90968.1 MAG: UDP-glucose 4-epimerase GalE [Candidatus Curtissbacteria bacterium RIFCSPHIGHO2_12_FULL_38_37]OGE01053.1 MAG: UDP-glucose 4-epimerase GalE [Candidatus Curtissbacteria bacterium RIFCSPLOWO2_02_FULL_40_11]OGE12855.1 MAG: UDP-glucose 4-epimerase GalE [Candidatus Curtissbacteria bacterium RIFCSPLOWO2_12_FULL_38_9]